MVQHATVPTDSQLDPEQNGMENLHRNYCDYTTYSKHCLGVHIGVRHKELQKPKAPHEKVSQSQNILDVPFSEINFIPNVIFRPYKLRLGSL